MLGLGAYDSSSEEEVEAKTPAPQVRTILLSCIERLN